MGFLNKRMIINDKRIEYFTMIEGLNFEGVNVLMTTDRMSFEGLNF